MSLYKSEYDENGVLNRYYWNEDDKTMDVRRTFNVDHILKSNVRRANATVDSRYGDEMLHHVAEIPLTMITYFLQEHNLDVFSPDENEKKRLLKLLDHPDYEYLKTTVKRLARRRAGTT